MSRRPSDPVLADRALFPRLAARLPVGIMGRAFYPLRSVDSTQNVAKELAEGGAPEGTVVVADHQTRGRGRTGRTWLAEPGANLLISVLLRPPLPLSRVPQLSLVAAVASREALEAQTGLLVGIRWPNDLLLAGRKVGGILVEAVSAARGLLHVVVGIGLNVNQTGFPDAIRDRATSLALALGHALDREELLAALLAEMDRWYARYFQRGFEPVRVAWCRSSATLGTWVVSGRGIAGTAVDLDEDGALVVRAPSGVVERVVAGEVEGTVPDAGAWGRAGFDRASGRD